MTMSYNVFQALVQTQGIGLYPAGERGVELKTSLYGYVFGKFEDGSIGRDTSFPSLVLEYKELDTQKKGLERLYRLHKSNCRRDSMLATEKEIQAIALRMGAIAMSLKLRGATPRDIYGD